MTQNEKILEAVVDLIGQQRQDTYNTVQKLIPLSNSNLELREIVREMEDANRKQDDRLAELRAKFSKIPEAKEPTNDPEAPEKPDTEQDKAPVSGDIDLISTEGVVIQNAESQMPAEFANNQDAPNPEAPVNGNEPDGDDDNDGTPARGRRKHAAK